VITRKRGAFGGLAILGLYTVISLLYFARALPGHPGTFYIGRDEDPLISMWFLRWWRYTLDQRINPFFTDLLWAPRGFNLAWSAFVPFPAWIAIPIGRTFGEAAAYNILSIIAVPLAAFSAFLLCRHLTRSFWPSILGGYIFGFSPYMLSHMLGGHLNLTFAFPIPLAVLAGLRRIDGRISTRRFMLEIAALLVVQFLCGIELFATMTVFGGFALLMALFFFEAETRARLIRLIGPLAAAYAIAICVLSPYFYFLFARGSAGPQAWPADRFTGDLLNFFIPTEVNLFGTFGFARAITGKFSGDLYENCSYIGIPMIIVVEAYRRLKWRTPAGKFLIVMLAITVVASFGPALRVAGRSTLPMPGAILTTLPVISSALAARFAIYMSLVISVIAAVWFTDAPATRSTKFFAALSVGLFLAPNPVSSFWISRLDIPAFFDDRTYANELEPREIVLPLPFPYSGKSMYWQAHSDMYFRMAGGWTTTTPFEFVRMPVVRYFYGGIDLPEAGDQLKSYIARFGVRAIVADPNEPNFESFQRTVDSLGVVGLNEKGVWIYKIPRDSFAEYANLPPAQLEARADALRFDAILEAAAKYLAEGHDLSTISPLELQRLALLPRDWIVNAAPDAYTDWQIGPVPSGQVGIIIVGSYDGVRPLLERYQSIASAIDYPGPTRWTPDSHPRLDAIAPMLVVLDPAHLLAAAKSLHDTPPPERTTSFLLGTSNVLLR
jgi:hypothetical protein